eukprot:gnl/MRDRNA2_/MRDRNA2_74829_c0_seq1.p1 gnl/MRDRNA2_/MRDRNA2_74829_c0~~gnl/MRDRNA2_/MRDRNA2_74829_c0_seq1.p1  ORF type:complete len:550 (-),score=86.21 gnl/MRDRNA2_/MRDRNA2_74829_c0_seq1:203-1852(-)
MLVVVLNTAYIGIQADHPSHAVNSVFDNLFCSFFTLELAVRLGALKRWSDCLRDYWFVFDGSLVLLMIGETWIMPLVLLTSSQESSAGLGKEYSVMRIARLLRLSRLGRIVRIIRIFPEVMTLLKGVSQAMRSVFFTLLLLLILLFLFAILFKTQSESTELENIFTSVSQSMWILLLHGALLDNPSTILNVVFETSPILAAVFLTFIFISNLTVLNMLIGILCDVVHQVSLHEKEQAAILDLKKALFELLDCFDKDDDRQIHRDEFELLLRNPELNLILKNFNVNCVDLMSLKDVLFDKQEVPASQQHPEAKTTDTNLLQLESNPTYQGSCEDAHKLTFDEFIEVVVRLRGGNSATVEDVVQLRDLIRLRFERLEQMSKIDGPALMHTNGRHATWSHHSDAPSPMTLQTQEPWQREMEARIIAQSKEMEQRQEARHADLLNKICSIQMDQQRQEGRLVDIAETICSMQKEQRLILDRVFQWGARGVQEKTPASQSHQQRCQDHQHHLDKNISDDYPTDMSLTQMEEMLRLPVHPPTMPPLPPGPPEQLN